MKMRYLRDKEGKIDKRYMIAKDGSYIRDKETGEKLDNIYINDGYRVISITLNGNYYNAIKISHLQWLSWKGIIPNGYHIHHNGKDKDGNYDKLNDDIDNLRCWTISEHMSFHSSGENCKFYGEDHSGEKGAFYDHRHTEESKKKQSIAKTGENNPRAKLSDKEVKEIRRLRYIKKWTYKSIANKCETSEGNVKDIVIGRRRNRDPLTNKVLTKQELIQQTIKEN